MRAGLHPDSRGRRWESREAFSGPPGDLGCVIVFGAGHSRWLPQQAVAIRKPLRGNGYRARVDPDAAYPRRA